jgi:hypothetical protein
MLKKKREMLKSVFELIYYRPIATEDKFVAAFNQIAVVIDPKIEVKYAHGKKFITCHSLNNLVRVDWSK